MRKKHGAATHGANTAVPYRVKVRERMKPSDVYVCPRYAMAKRTELRQKYGLDEQSGRHAVSVHTRKHTNTHAQARAHLVVLRRTALWQAHCSGSSSARRTAAHSGGATTVR